MQKEIVTYNSLNKGLEIEVEIWKMKLRMSKCAQLNKTKILFLFKFRKCEKLIIKFTHFFIYCFACSINHHRTVLMIQIKNTLKKNKIRDMFNMQSEVRKFWIWFFFKRLFFLSFIWLFNSIVIFLDSVCMRSNFFQ